MVAPRTDKRKESQDVYMGKLQDIKVRVPKEYYEKRRSIVDLDKYVVSTGHSAEKIDDHIRELRDNDRY